MLRLFVICAFFGVASVAQCLGGECSGSKESGISPPTKGASAEAVHPAPIHVVRDSSGERVWFAGAEGPLYDEIVDAEVSPDGRRLVYVARRGGGLVVVADGRESSLYEEIGELRFSPEGSRLAYRAKKGGGGRGGGWVMVVDRREGRDYMMIAEESPTFSRDGRSIAYVVRHHAHLGLGWRFLVGFHITERVPSVVVVDEEEGPRLDYVVAESLAFSPDGRHIAYVGMLRNNVTVFMDGLPCKGCVNLTGWFDSRWFVFSPDNRRLAYWASNRWRVIVNGEAREAGPEDDLAIPSLDTFNDPLRSLGLGIGTYMVTHSARSHTLPPMDTPKALQEALEKPYRGIPQLPVDLH